MIRNYATQGQTIDLRRKISLSRLSNSFSSSKISLSGIHSLAESTMRSKGYSFGTASRKSMIEVNIHSPAAKYNIQGLVEINLNKKKGTKFGSSRQTSVEKTPLSYISNNLNPGPGTYNREVLHKSSSGVKIGKRNNQTLKVGFLNDKVIDNNPGPGAYHSKVVKLKGGKMTTKSTRFDKSNKENLPGVGAYNVSNIQSVSKGSRIAYASIKL